MIVCLQSHSLYASNSIMDLAKVETTWTRLLWCDNILPAIWQSDEVPRGIILLSDFL